MMKCLKFCGSSNYDDQEVYLGWVPEFGKKVYSDNVEKDSIDIINELVK